MDAVLHARRHEHSPGTRGDPVHALVADIHDRDVLTVAINERYAEMGGDHPIPYSDDDPVDQ